MPVDLAPALPRAFAAFRAGRLPEAEALARAAVAAAPADARAIHLLALVVKAARRTDEALALLAEAVRLDPAYAEARFNLANTQRAAGRADEAAASYRALLACKPDHAAAHHLLGATLAEQGDAAAARDHLERAIALDPRLGAAHTELGNLLQQQGDHAGAVASYGRALALAPGDARVLNNLASAELKRGGAAAALAATDAVLTREPFNQRALAYRTAALAALGRGAEALAFADPEALVAALPLAAPAPYADMAALNAALEAEIRSHRTLTASWNPGQRAARGGALATDLFVDPPPALGAFHAALRAAIDRFIAALPSAVPAVAGLPGNAAHPFLARRPRAYVLDAWANILPAGGRQASHIHNLGWLSGVYYVAMPPGLGAGATAEDRAGWIEFGRPGYGLPEIDPPRLAFRRPAPGLALVFPSYLWHGTLAFTGDGERISIAFDLHVKG